MVATAPAPTTRRRASKKAAAATPVTPASPATPSTPAPAPVVQLTQSQIVALEELRTLKAHQRTLKARDEELTEELKGVLRGSGGGVDENGVLLASVSDRAGRRSVDYGRLASRYPDAYKDTVSVGNDSEVLTLHKPK